MNRLLLADAFGVSPVRIVLDPRPGSATVEDAVRLLHSDRKRACELIDGTLIERDADFFHAIIAGEVLWRLNGFATAHDCGCVVGAGGGVQLWAGRIRFSHALFFRWERFAGRGIPKEPIPLLVPDLAVEVLSDSNTAKEMALKRKDYFASDTRTVWEIDPMARTVEVFTGPDDSTTVDAAGTLDGGDVLPGFALPVRDLFAKLDRMG